MRAVRFFTIVGAVGAALLLWGYGNAVGDPVTRRADIEMPGWPQGAPPLRAILISDLHVAGPDMPPERLARIVGRINALAPDIVLIAGDLVSDKGVKSRSYSLAEAVAPLARLRPRLGVYAVLGNHDHWRDARDARAALADNSIIVLDNDARQAGPLSLGGLGDAFTGHDDMAATLERMRALPGARLLLSHSPDPFPGLPIDVPLMVAGHTHCGQIRLPMVGALTYMSEHGDRYACGLVREGGKALIVSAGLGTSLLPLRFGAAPDLWLITLRPAGAR